ncbi:MAG TPA: DUF523 and DUF1722 domain-containing protein [Candidatus Polarisedimenticolia bacterium]|nr:DUF523 and DUF1722 domain-containing protein [Candidatus Polarisedimenticolia bacterium]
MAGSRRARAEPRSRPVAEAPLRIGISSCLLGEEVRWDGGHKRDVYIKDLLGRFFEWVPVCPELEVGMGVPREPIHLAGDAGKERLVGVRSGKDWTAAMQRYARRRVRQMEQLDLSGYLLKKDSPSCGMERVRVYPARGPASRNGVGAFASVLMAGMPLLPVEEEGRLHDPALRENFIERVFAYRRLQDWMTGGSTRSGLVAFHTAHKYLLLSHSPRHYQELGRLVAAAKRYSPKRLGELYARLFMEALRIPATVKRHSNVLQHIAGFLKEHLGPDEKQELQGILDDYRKGWIPLVVPLTLLSHHVNRHQIDYILDQAYLHPHPKELMLLNHA